MTDELQAVVDEATAKQIGMLANARNEWKDASTWSIESEFGLKEACEAMFPDGKSGYEEGDEKAPFFSEAYLYPLLGKNAARTVLAAWNRVGRAMGIER